MRFGVGNNPSLGKDMKSGQPLMSIDFTTYSQIQAIHQSQSQRDF